MHPKLKEVLDYRDNPAINQSFLKTLETGFITKKKQSLSMLLGSLTDNYICLYECLDELYFVYDGKRPTDVICEIVDNVILQLLDYYQVDTLEDLQEELFCFTKNIEIALNTIPYQGNWKLQTKIDKILSEGSNYFNLKKTLGTKEIITKTEIERTHIVVQKLYENEPSKSILLNATFFQLPLYANYNGVDMKGLLDCIYLDHDNKITYVTDFKRTDFPLSQYKKVIQKFRYGFQASYYKYITEQNYPDYTVIMQLLFISEFDGKSLLFIFNEEDLDFEASGYYEIDGSIYCDKTDKTKVKTNYIKGWKDLLEIYKQGQELGIKNYDIAYYNNSGIFNESIF